MQILTNYDSNALKLGLRLQFLFVQLLKALFLPSPRTLHGFFLGLKVHALHSVGLGPPTFLSLNHTVTFLIEVVEF